MKGYEIRPPIRKNKKYSVFKDGKYLLSFGDSNFQQYKDRTKLKLWSHLDHGDLQRRYRYYQRHGYSTDKNSAKYWSGKYLW